MIVQDLFKDIDRILLAKKFRYCSFKLEEKFQNLGEEKFIELVTNTINDILKITPMVCEDFIFIEKYFDLNKDIEPYLAPSIIEKNDLLKYKNFILKQATNFSVSDEKNLNKPTVYSVFLLSREEILGYQFSEYCLSVYDKYEIIASILFELTWFGYSNETYEQNLEIEKKRLDRQLENQKLDEVSKDEDEIYENEETEVYEYEYIPPTEEELNQNLIINQIPIYKDFEYILNTYVKEK